MSNITSISNVNGTEPWRTDTAFAPRSRTVRRRDRFGWQDAIAYLLAAFVLTLSAVLPALLGRY